MPPLKCDYTEQTVSLMIQMFLTAISHPKLRYTIELFSQRQERWLGADARLTSRIRGFRPFYMQFKRPSAWTGSSKADIVKERREKGLSVSPITLFFELQDKRPHHHDFQHNILHRLGARLSKWALGDAAYVCPLFLNTQQYLLQVHSASLSWQNVALPFILAPVQLQTEFSRFQFNSIPVFDQHVSIPAHAPLGHANHSYSFTETGPQVLFHSPERVPEGPMPLLDWLNSLIPNRDSATINSRNTELRMRQLFEALDLTPESVIPRWATIKEAGIASWLFLGDYLLQNYNIEQYAFVQWQE